METTNAKNIPPEFIQQNTPNESTDLNGSINPNHSNLSNRPISPNYIDQKASSTSRYSGRLVALDIARGLAIIGMIWAHTTLFIPETKVGELFAQIPHGRSALLFTFLAGVSISIITGRNKSYTGAAMNSARLRIVGRALGLLFITTLLFTFEHPIAVILGYYALWFLISILFVNLSAKKLLISGFVLGVLGPIAMQFLLSAEMSGSYFVNATGPNAMMSSGLFSGIYPGLSYMSPVLVGMGIGRLNLNSSKLHLKMLVGGIILATVTYLGAWGATHTFAKPGSDYEFLNSSSNISSSLIAGETSGSAIIGSKSIYEEILTTEDLISTKQDIKSTTDIKLSTLQKLIDSQQDITYTDYQNKITQQLYPDFYSESGEEEPWPSEEDPSFILPDLYLFFDASPHTNSSFEILGSIGVSLALLGLLFLGQKFFRYLLYPVAALGSMALTAYVAHVIIIGFGPEWIIGEDFGGFALVTLSIMAFCLLWSLIFKKGPLEFLLSKFADFVGKSPESSNISSSAASETLISSDENTGSVSTPSIKVEVLTQS